MRTVIFTYLMSALLFVVAPVYADNGGLSSMRSAELDSVPKAADFSKTSRDQAPIRRDYLHQPPLIPHDIRGYAVDKNGNKCLSCHSWANYQKSGATKLSMMHFETRDGAALSDVSPRRYFCLQCHITQTDTNIVIDNSFQPVKALRHSK